MNWTSIIAIYALFWVMSTFVMLSFGVRTHDEAGIAKVPGQADSAPAHFRPGQVMLRGTLLAAVLFGAYYLNWTQGWITMDDLNFIGQPPRAEGAANR